MSTHYKLPTFFIIPFSLFLLTSCGGGGGGGEPPPPPTPSGVSISVKVIDRYITGANVYIDFNWNLQQDEGEPSAYVDSDGYYFSSGNGEFDAIENFSSECVAKRIKIADIPVGAVDSDRGTVSEAFTMYHVPGIPSGGIVNISPFTGLFLDIVSSVKDDLNLSAITVTTGCGPGADAIADNVIAKVVEFVEDLEASLGISLSDLYEDYIASNDAERRAKAEKIVTFLQATQGVRNAIKNHFASELVDDFEVYGGLSKQAAEQLFGPNFESITFLEMSIGFNFDGEADTEGWYPSHYFHTGMIKLFANGMIANYACTPSAGNTSCSSFDPTYGNILNQLQSYLNYRGHKNGLIIPDVRISSQYREARIRDGEELECQFSAMLIFDENRTCTEEGCPDQIGVQKQIVHNIGHEFPAVCTSHDNPFLYIFNSQKNNWNGTNEEGITEDNYGVQYRLLEDSNVFSNPPLAFLGTDISNLNYPVTYSKIKELYITMDSASTIQSSLLNGEWVVISRTTYEENGNLTVGKNRYEYHVKYGDSSDNRCQFHSWDGSGWVTDSETEGIGAFSACYDLINAFKFYD